MRGGHDGAATGPGYIRGKNWRGPVQTEERPPRDPGSSKPDEPSQVGRGVGHTLLRSRGGKGVSGEASDPSRGFASFIQCVLSVSIALFLFLGL